MYSIYEVKKNETLDDIANKLNISVQEIMNLNNNLNNVIEGQLIIIPTTSNYNVYVVKKGDNLYNIAKRYGVDVKSIELLNGLKENEYIYPEQKLLIPTSKIYITRENDTIKQLLNNGITLEELKDNDIYLQQDQIIFYKKD